MNTQSVPTDVPTFAGATAIVRAAPGEYRTDLLPQWASLFGIHGGYTTAIATRAIAAEIGDSTRAIRSVSARFIRSPDPGPATVNISIDKAGRTATFATATVAQSGRTCVVVTAFAGDPRAGQEFDDCSSSVAPRPPDGLARITSPPEVRSPEGLIYFDNSELILSADSVPFSRGDRARLAGWLRPLADEQASALWLVCICDFFPPAVFARTARPVPASTIDLVVNVLVTDAELERLVAPGDYVYAEMVSAHSTGGYAVEDGVIWAPDGSTIATTRQFRLGG